MSRQRRIERRTRTFVSNSVERSWERIHEEVEEEKKKKLVAAVSDTAVVSLGRCAMTLKVGFSGGVTAPQHLTLDSP